MIEITAAEALRISTLAADHKRLNGMIKNAAIQGKQRVSTIVSYANHHKILKELKQKGFQTRVDNLTNFDVTIKIFW